VPDEPESIRSELNRLRALADGVVVSGGIGPTHDDHTRPAIAAALGLELQRHPQALERIRGFYGERVTEAELEMADFPRGARLVEGHATGSFGFEVGGVYALPGVPRLFLDLIEGITPDFRAEPLHKLELHSGRREGELAPQLAAAEGSADGVAIGSYPVCDDDGCWHVRVVLRGSDPEQLADVARALEPRL